MDHKDLRTWKVAIELAKSIYSTTVEFPSHERYGMVNQIRRAAVSIPSNIAEGCGRKSDKELVQFLHIALGSLAELETLLILSSDFGYLDSIELYHRDITRLRKLILGLRNYLR